MNYINHTIISKIHKIRSKNTHKGDFGKILCIAGSEDYIGAVSLAVNAAIATLRAGADIVTVAAPEKVAYAINTLSPDVISKKMKGKYFSENHTQSILDMSKSFDCVLIGPGMGQRDETFNFINQVITNIKKPLVIDADAIKAVKLNDLNNSIITPHQKELSTCLANSNISIEKTIDLQNYLHDNIVLLKGSTDTIISDNQISYNKTGNPGMTVGGTGDVLAGITAGLVAQKISLFDAACASAYISGRIGDKLYEKYGYGFIASDFLKEIPSTIKEHLKN